LSDKFTFLIKCKILKLSIYNVEAIKFNKKGNYKNAINAIA